MATIIHMMGPTCAGKSTIIDKMVSLSDAVYPVQIGKILRKKYGEDYFKGQAAPEHTKNEALNIYYDTIIEGITLEKKIILVDGQPRDVEQAQLMIKAWKRPHVSRFLLIHASHEARETRARAGRTPGPDLDLTVARLTNDYKNNYTVMVELMLNNITVDVVDTSDALYNTDSYCKYLLQGAV